MKVLHINLLDKSGGAAKAAYRLHKGLLEAGVKSEMLVQLKEGDDYTVDGPQGKIERFFAILRPTLDQMPLLLYGKRENVLFSPSFLLSRKMLKKIRSKKPDIVHLHWICGGTLRLEELAEIEQPIVWTLHDMWPFTGGCHYSGDCDRFLDGCGRCPKLGSTKNGDLSRRVFRRKAKIYKRVQNRLTIVGLSHWIGNLSQKSILLGDIPHVHLPNPIDTTLYKPIDRHVARALWQLPENKQLILFGAVSATEDPRKGFNELRKALSLVYKKTKDVELVVFGSGKPERGDGFDFKVHYVGHLHDDAALVSLYNAVDVMVVSSIQEAFGQTASEAMSCGTPVVAFESTGLPDIVNHKEDGYLAKPYDVKDLADGIGWVLENEDYTLLRINARKKILKKFGSKKVTKQYIDLYRNVMRAENPQSRRE
ncbi:glycosyltransferase family 4 protein [Hydrogenimonas urashimensis]|uniref:glycosyltransferase family 4 protein n=1 Tax=Hydrogenimonas urashimensis TaxID=2740515 RepID=UPI001915EE9D|nr:glycosyltransferase family 4 protein [Hydrogenimonas urashimensis]